MPGVCVKQNVVAVLVTPHGVFSGSNECSNPQWKCPRDSYGYKSGEGYHLCTVVCGQKSHAEVAACLAAGGKAHGGTMHIFGHTYCCDNCKETMDAYGVASVVIH
jgi:deoxycytidylate deaminase